MALRRARKAAHVERKHGAGLAKNLVELGGDGRAALRMVDQRVEQAGERRAAVAPPERYVIVLDRRRHAGSPAIGEAPRALFRKRGARGRIAP